jgi:hypothetical protein
MHTTQVRGAPRLCIFIYYSFLLIDMSLLFYGSSCPTLAETEQSNSIPCGCDADKIGRLLRYNFNRKWLKFIS